MDHVWRRYEVGESEVVDTAQEVAEILGATLLPIRDEIPFDELKRFDVIFNLCEGVQGNPRLEMHFALALEGSGQSAQAQTLEVA